jgi:hypothetical protein
MSVNESVHVECRSERTLESLGAPVSQHAPSPANKIAGVIISLLLVGGGLAIAWFVIRGLVETGGQMPFYAEKGWCWFAVVLGGAIAVFLFFAGIALFYYVWNLFSLRVLSCPDGFYCVQGEQTDVFAWDEIVSVQETVSRESLPLVKGAARHLMPRITSQSYLVKRCDGKEFAFDGNIMPRVQALAVPLRVATQKRSIPWSTVEETA